MSIKFKIVNGVLGMLSPHFRQDTTAPTHAHSPRGPRTQTINNGSVPDSIGTLATTETLGSGSLSPPFDDASAKGSEYSHTSKAEVAAPRWLLTIPVYETSRENKDRTVKSPCLSTGDTHRWDRLGEGGRRFASDWKKNQVWKEVMQDLETMEREIHSAAYDAEKSVEAAWSSRFTDVIAAVKDASARVNEGEEEHVDVRIEGTGLDGTVSWWCSEGERTGTVDRETGLKLCERCSKAKSSTASSTTPAGGSRKKPFWKR